MKTPSVIKEWLTEFKTLKEGDEAGYGARLLQREDLVKRLTEFIEQCYAKDELDPVLSQLFNCFRHSLRDIYLFALQLMPCLIYVYLRNFTAWKDYGETMESLETCLLGMYNLVNTKMRPPTSASSMCSLTEFRVPSIASPSIYHDGLAQPALFDREELSAGLVVRTGLQHSIERRVTAENRFQVLTILQMLYNDELASLPRAALQHFLVSFQRLVSLDAEPRIPLAHMHGCSQFVVQCLTALYFSLFNGNAPRGLTALTALEQRAMFELMGEVLLVVNAIRNSLETNPSGQPEDGPMGIKAELASTPPAAREARARGHTRHADGSRRASALMRSNTVITNASFRTRKLPEDITVDEDSFSSGPNLNMSSRSAGVNSIFSNDMPEHSSSGVYVTPSFTGETTSGSSSRPASFLSASSTSRKSEKQRARDVDEISLEMTKM